jgi:hypothetical protein
MVNLEINKKYSLKLGHAEPIDSIYLGRKRSRRRCMHVFLAYTLAYRTYIDYRFYNGFTKARIGVVRSLILKPKISYSRSTLIEHDSTNCSTKVQ